MNPLLLSLSILATGGLLALLAGRRPAWSAAFGALGALLGSLALVPVILAPLVGGDPLAFSFPWSVPGGAFAFRVDALAAVFLIPLALVTAVAALYGAGYLRHGGHAERSGPAWFLYNLLTASMIAVCTAANGLFFLLAWEMMSLVSFFLVAFESDRE